MGRLVGFAAVLLLWSVSVFGNDTLQHVMARMKPQSALRIIYRETRYLSLLAEPWQGYGYLFAMPPDAIIKEQNFPHQELMGAIGDNLYYLQAEENIYYRGNLNSEQVISLNVAAFKALVNGDQALMEKLYQIEFQADARQWLLILKPHNDTARETLDRIEISGPATGIAKKIIVFQKDGDRTEFELQMDGEGELIQEKISALQKQLQRH